MSDDKAQDKGQLSADEVAEFRRLRKEEAERQQAVKDAEEEAERNKPPVSHYLHLANGDVVESAGTMTHFGPDSIPVVGSYPVEERKEAAK